MSEAIPPLPCMPPWNGQGKLYFFFFSTLFTCYCIASFIGQFASYSQTHINSIHHTVSLNMNQ